MVDFPDMKEMVEQYQEKQKHIVVLDRFKIRVDFLNSSVTFICYTKKSRNEFHRINDLIAFTSTLDTVSEIFPFQINDKGENFKMCLIMDANDKRVNEEKKIVFSHSKEQGHIIEARQLLNDDYSEPVSHAGEKIDNPIYLFYLQ